MLGRPQCRTGKREAAGELRVEARARPAWPRGPLGGRTWWGGKLARQRVLCGTEQSGEESSRQQRETQMRSEKKQEI